MFAAVLLAAAIAMEVSATAALPHTDSFTSPLPTALVIAGYAGSICLLAIVVKTVPVSITYAVWAGIGTASVAVIGYLFLGEQMSWVKVLSLVLIIAGVIGLNLAGA